MNPNQQLETILDLLALALPYVECAEDDPGYDKGVVKQLSKRIRRVIEQSDPLYDPNTDFNIHLADVR